MIPGSNLLAFAFSMITPQPFGYEPFLGRVNNAVGLYESSYGELQTLMGSIQAVSRRVYQDYGLDFQKNYVTIYVSKNVIDVTRDTSGDRATINGRLFQIISQTDWFNIDGWVSFLAVDVGPVSGPV